MQQHSGASLRFHVVARPTESPIGSPRAGTRYRVQYLIHQMSTASLARLGQVAPCPLQKKVRSFTSLQMFHTHNLSTHNLFTHNLLTHFFTHNLKHHLFTHGLFTHNLLTHNLLTHSLSTHNLLTPDLFTHNVFTHDLLTHNLLTHKLLTHNLLTHNLLTHNLSNHNLLTNNSSTHNLPAGMALGNIDLPFVWQAWPFATWTCILRGRRGGC